MDRQAKSNAFFGLCFILFLAGFLRAQETTTSDEIEVSTELEKVVETTEDPLKNSTLVEKEDMTEPRCSAERLRKCQVGLMSFDFNRRLESKECFKALSFMDCLLDMNSCPEHKSTDFLFSNLILNSTEEILDRCRTMIVPDVAHHQLNTTIFESDACVSYDAIRTCDKRLPVAFDIAHNSIVSSNECFRLAEYFRCVTKAVDDSCFKESEATREEIKAYLMSRVQVQQYVCEKILIEFDQHPTQDMSTKRFGISTHGALEIILGHDCTEKTKSLIGVCVDQYERRIEESKRQAALGSSALPVLCCSSEEFGLCVKTITSIKCGKKLGASIFTRLEYLAHKVNSDECEKYSYGSDVCESALNSGLPSSSTNTVVMIILMILVSCF